LYKESVRAERGWVEVDVETFIDSDVRSVFLIGLSNKTYFYIKNDNSLWGWGSNRNGVLGDGTGVDRDSPVYITDDVATVGISDNIMWAIKTDKTLWVWGSHGNFSPVVIAENVVYNLGVVARWGDSPRCFVLTSDGFILDTLTNDILLDERYYYTVMDGWSINTNHDLVRLNANNQRQLESTLITDDDVTRFIANDTNVHFFKTDGSLWGFGNNANGQLGDGTRVPRNEPVKIANDAIEVVGQAYLTSTGELWTWIGNDPTPNKIMDNIAHISISNRYFWAMTLDGTVYYDWSWDGVKEKKHEISSVRLPQTVTFP
jgi:alpha-tubulin suppressor-like RCC1 family protein